ncbi:FAD-binding oxidoreductase [Corticibacter populi]|uniref:FAD-binding oxidoreductase n=1 Tax=Corticibacter populi TaxID=1550736 RepID=A0A3M6QV32_9BURK|nr:FAD-binding oxidoreductase [Corticibacter populi]RMX06868.1 FAD-binding oxidoreductase [Corticibacter populi]RZS31540.1 FAD/FMN-containing dehydrogenase [Corticibacter populi]
MSFDSQSWLARARALIGDAHVLSSDRGDDLSAYTRDWRNKFEGPALAVLRPANTEEVQAIVRLAAATGVAIVPQGGNTGLCGASVPGSTGPRAVVLQLGRLNRILDIDVENNTATVEAGCVLQTLQQQAAAVGRLFPLSLGAEGSCQIGGNIATNAGGVQVLRYGNTRDLVLGLEVVLPDGERLDLLRGLRKDNTGYDLKQLFIGAEGTLGIITAATVKLFAAPDARVVAFAGVASVAQAVQLLGAMRQRLGERFTAFELISGEAIALVRHYFPDTPAPLQGDWPWYVLMEAADGGDDAVLREAMQTALMACMEDGQLEDVALAGNVAQGQALWMLRENITHAQQMDGSNIKHDVSLPISRIPAFVAAMLPQLAQAFPGARPIVYGHLGDGNLHFNVSAPAAIEPGSWQLQTDAVNQVIHDAVAALHGSISAEHGIGQLKRHELPLYKSAIELDVMRRVKQALDPVGLMNPGKVL